MATPGNDHDERPAHGPGVSRELRAGPPAAATRRFEMGERLELALSWNSVAAELRAGIGADVRPPR